ncbi:hypothetical protein ACLB1E_29420 [Escherichia coli]
MSRRKPIPWQPVQVNDLELALFPDERGRLSIEILAKSSQRYDRANVNPAC